MAQGPGVFRGDKEGRSAAVASAPGAHRGRRARLATLERLHPARFARPEVMNQIAVVNQAGKASAERVIVLPAEEFDALVDRPGYCLRNNGDLERREGSLVYLIVRQQSNRALPMGE